MSRIEALAVAKHVVQGYISYSRLIKKEPLIALGSDQGVTVRPGPNSHFIEGAVIRLIDS